MTSLEQLRSLLKARPGAPRWPYLLPMLVVLLFVGHAFEDSGWQGGSVYVLLLLLCGANLVRPTVLGWGLIACPFLAFGVVVALSGANGPPGEWVFFLLLAFVPVIALWLGRPWAKRSAALGPERE